MLISTQHADGIDAQSQIKPDLIEHVLQPILARSHVRRGAPRAPRLRLRQPDRQVRRRRADGRHRPHGTQDHRGHLRWRRTARRRGVLRQGSDQGRPLGGLRGPLRGEEHRRRGPRRSLRAAGRIRDRRSAPVLDARSVLRHRARADRDDRRADPGALRPPAGGDHPRSRSPPPDLRQDGGLRPFRPRRPRLHLGADRQGGDAARSCGLPTLGGAVGGSG